MLTTDDVENLFLSMRTAYGSQWKHGHGAVRVWRNALSRHTSHDLQHAANEAMRHYVDHPPTLPQFLKLVELPPRPNTYLPAPSFTPTQRAANQVLRIILQNHGGVDSHTLANLVALKNALIEDHGDEHPTEPFLADLEDQLQALANNHDTERKAIEREEDRRKFCITRGVKYRHISEYA